MKITHVHLKEKFRILEKKKSLFAFFLLQLDEKIDTTISKKASKCKCKV